MKKLLTLFLLPVTGILLLNSCVEIEKPVRYLSVNGDKVELTSAYMTDYGTDYNISLREYELEFNSTDINPSDFLRFTIYSTNTTRLQEGTYTFLYHSYEPGKIGYIDFGSNIHYDESNQAISGTRINEDDAIFSGTVTVNWENDKYYFIIDLTIEFNGNMYYLEGEYNDVITELSGI